MSLFRPNTGNEAEDRMAQVPLFCCLVPLLLVALVGGALLVWLL